MIDYIIGDVVHIGDDYFILDNNGMGYKITTSVNTLVALSQDRENQKIHTSLIVREDGMFLFGFKFIEEMDMFKLLLNVSKVGPKVACGILSALRPSQIQRAIVTKDIDTLTKGPGVGKKTAERIVLELKDKVNKNFDMDDETTIHHGSTNYDEAVEALISLGYNRYQVEKSLRGMETDHMTIEEIIKHGLRQLAM